MKKILLSLLFCSGASQAEFMDGNKLLNDMRDASNFLQGHALGYVVGVADMGVGIVHCPPGNVTAGQLRDMVKNYLENMPAERHKSADEIVNKILKTMWPCAKRGSAM